MIQRKACRSLYYSYCIAYIIVTVYSKWRLRANVSKSAVMIFLNMLQMAVGSGESIIL